MDIKLSFYKKILILFSKRDVSSAAWLFVGMVLLGLLEVIGVASIMPFMAVVSSPKMIEENEYLNLVYAAGGFDSHSDFAVSLGFGMLCIIIVTNGIQRL